MACPAIALGVLAVETRLPRRLVLQERVSRRVVFALDALDGPVAVKLSASPDAVDTRDLAREFERLAALAHPAFTRAGSFGFLADGRAWFSMERAAGELPAGPLSWADVGLLADGACEALAALHARQLLHRDVKRCHVRFDGTSGRVMLLDLGSASPPGPVARRIGTPGSMAPEIVEGRGADERSDLYGLGVVLYELVTGRAPWTGSGPDLLQAQRAARFEALDALRPDAPLAFTRLVSALMSPDPCARPESAAGCRQLIADALGTTPGEILGMPPVMGRDREIDALLEMTERARHQPVVVSLAGPDGSGRSSLLEVLRCRLMLDGVPVIRRQATGGLNLAQLARDISLVVDAPLGATPGSPREEVASALAGACEAIATNAAMPGPLAILVDDADDIDPESSETRFRLAELASCLPAGVLLVVADAPRAEPFGESPFRVDLGPLPGSSVRGLLRAWRRSEPDDDLLARAMVTTRQPAAILGVLDPDAEGRAGRSAIDEDDPLQLMRSGRIPAAVAAWQARQLVLGAGFEGERARVLARLGNALWAMAEPADALARAESALALAAAHGDAEAEAEAARVLGRIYGSFGSTRDGVGWHRRALEIAGEHEGVTRHEALAELGLLMVREGHVEAALRALTESVREAESNGDAAGAALARARLGRARLVGGDLGGAERLLRRALAEATADGDCLVVIEAQRLLGSAEFACGARDEALRLLEGALDRALACGAHQEMPALHEALAQVHLHGSVRLRTSTGAIVDRSRLEIARAHVEKGMDLTLSTGRMADRAGLAVLAARCALLLSDPRGALALAEEAHGLAIEAGDLLVASQARLVKSEALLDVREFGVALAEARIACEAFDRSGDLENAWRGHALLARVHGAWGMGAKQVQETEFAARLLHRLEASLKDPRARRAYLADVERAAALLPPLAVDATKARRANAPELAGERFVGRADTEDLVEALIGAQQRNVALERRVRMTRAVARDARVRRDALMNACLLAASAAPRPRDLARVLDLVSRACGGAHVVLATSQAGRLRVRGASGSRAAGDSTALESALVVARRVVETGRGSLALGALGNRRTDPASGDVHVAIPLDSETGTFGALVVRACEGRSLRRADIRLLRATATLMARALLASRTHEEASV